VTVKPRGVLTEAEIAEIRARKPEIVVLLAHPSAPEPSTGAHEGRTHDFSTADARCVIWLHTALGTVGIDTSAWWPGAGGGRKDGSPVTSVEDWSGAPDNPPVELWSRTYPRATLPDALAEAHEQVVAAVRAGVLP